MAAADDIARMADQGSHRGGSVFGMRGLVPSLVVSFVAHGLVLAVLVSAVRPLVSPVRIFPVSLVDDPGSAGDGTPGEGSAPAAAPVPVVPPRRPAPAPRRTVRPAPAAGDVANATPGPAEGVGSAGTGTGDGSGGAGGGAGAAYGTNPPPPYPLVARRLGMQGLVELDVLVSADGRAADVRIRRSSGFPALDAAALTTVRERWRFVPARRGAAAIESRVTVPIVFRLDGVETGEPRG